ncbi:MAG TPA: DUF5661 family protein [Anaerolineales bacterium]|nr:DUF5661 family protein [Anaerolineales bacterium]
MKKRKQISIEDARRIGDSLYLDWEQVDLKQFHQGLVKKHKQYTLSPGLGPTYQSVIKTGKVILAHMQNIPDYFNHLDNLRSEVEKYRNTSS